MHVEKPGQQQSSTKGEPGTGTIISEPPLLGEQGEDALSILLYVSAGEKIQFHVRIIPKNAPESKEGEPARSL